MYIKEIPRKRLAAEAGLPYHGREWPPPKYICKLLENLGMIETEKDDPKRNPIEPCRQYAANGSIYCLPN
jgi:hypothetical protein